MRIIDMSLQAWSLADSTLDPSFSEGGRGGGGVDRMALNISLFFLFWENLDNVVIQLKFTINLILQVGNLIIVSYYSGW